MILSFNVRVEVDHNGEKWVPYLLGTLNKGAGHAGKVKSVEFERNTYGDSKVCEAIEFQLWEEGKIDL